LDHQDRVPVGEFAFDARVALSRRAEQSLDLQYYYIHRDEAGRTLLRELRDAALRGVRVRLLVDDFFAAEIDDLLIGLASFRNVEVRLFNPMPLRRGAPVFRLVLSPGDFRSTTIGCTTNCSWPTTRWPSMAGATLPTNTS
jgi:putative cardiolipin synthase